MAIVCGYLGDAYHRLVGEYPKAVDFHISSLNFGEEVRYQVTMSLTVFIHPN